MGRRNRIGLAICAVLGVGDVLSLVTLPSDPTSSDPAAGPPTSVLVATTVLGVVTLLAVPLAWRWANRPAARVVVGSRVLSAISGLPAFLVDGVPAAVVLIAAGGVAVTAVAVWLTLTPPGP